MMEMTYLRVPQQPDPECGFPTDVVEVVSPRKSSLVRRIVRFINSYLQITSSAYNHGTLERKLSFGVFMVLFSCFLFTCIYIASMGDMCGSYDEGIRRVKADRDRLLAEVSLLKTQLQAMTNHTEPNI
jgi:hypothetical protein